MRRGFIAKALYGVDLHVLALDMDKSDIFVGRPPIRGFYFLSHVEVEVYIYRECVYANQDSGLEVLGPLVKNFITQGVSSCYGGL